MAKGAQKKVDSIPLIHVINIQAAEGMLYQTERELAEVLKRCLEGSENPKDWQGLDDKRREVVKYNMQYTLAILELVNSQKRA